MKTRLTERGPTVKEATRQHSTRDKVEHMRKRIDQCLCRGHTAAGQQRNGIIHRVFAARHYDGIRCLVAWDSLTGGNPVFAYHDVNEIEAY